MTTTDAGYIEPVGTHQAYLRRGFAKAVIRECFARMKANGIRTVEIASRAEPAVANFLHDSLSPRRCSRLRVLDQPDSSPARWCG